MLLRHELPPTGSRASHWDLLLAVGRVLRAWSLDAAPAADVQTTALPLPDHRLAYLRYEGPISGDRGHVTQVDAGTYELLADEPHRYEVRLSGRSFVGTVRLELVAGQWFARCSDSSLGTR